MPQITVKDANGVNQTIGVITNTGTATSANSTPVCPASDATFPVSGPLTDAQLRASAVPVSAAALPLPSGAATEATLSAMNAKYPALGAALVTGSQPVSNPRKLGITGFASVALSTTYTNLLDSAAGTTATDVRDYQSGLLVVVSTATTGSYTIQGAFDSAFTVGVITLQTPDVTSQSANPVAAAVTPTANTRVFQLNLQGINFLRVNLSTGLTAGTIQAFVALNQTPHIPMQFNVQQANASSNNASVVGNVAHSTASSGNPVRVGGRVITTLDTTLIQGDVSDLAITSGQQVVVKPFASSENDWQFTGTLTTNVATAARAAGAASIRNFVTSVTVQNTNATATTFLIQDGATTIWQISLPASMTLPVTFNWDTPLRGTAATALNVNCGTTGANVLTNVSGFQSF